MSLRPANYEAAKASYKPMRRTGFKFSTSEEGDTLQEQKAGKGKYLQRRLRLKRKPMSAADRKWRAEVLERDGYRCRWVDENGERCEIEGAENLDAHHILTRGQRPDKRFDLTNGATLCGGPGRHHDKLHHTVKGRERGRLIGLLGTETYEAAQKAFDAST